jgi:YVTN family beta-propeller protein
VLSVAGTDLIHWININGAASSVLGTTLAGQTGSAFAYSYTETSGIEFSPDGSVLAVCRSFDDQIRLINSTTREVITDVTVGDFPIRIGFVPDGTRAYVSNTFSDDISVISIAGASSTLLTTIPGIDTPFRVSAHCSESPSSARQATQSSARSRYPTRASRGIWS